MDWPQLAVFIVSVFVLFLWNRAESRTDIRQMDAKLEATRDLCLGMIKAIQDEMKDFHVRLEKQDWEFRSRMEKQDAEFKAHMKYEHKK